MKQDLTTQAKAGDLSLQKAAFEDCKRKLAGWSLAVCPARDCLSQDEVSSALQQAAIDLEPCNKDLLFNMVIEFCNVCVAFGWINSTSPDALITIAKHYCKTLEAIPKEYIQQILDRVIQTWTGGQYAKMPSPAHITECIPTAYWEKKDVYRKLQTAEISLRHNPPAKPVDPKDMVKVKLSDFGFGLRSVQEDNLG